MSGLWTGGKNGQRNGADQTEQRNEDDRGTLKNISKYHPATQ